MIRATTILPAGSWTGAVADTVLLDYEARRRGRLAMSAKGGVSFLLDLPMPVGLRDGDALLLEDGRIIAVEAAREPLIEVSASSLPKLVRIVWHIGNRQLATQMMGDHLRIRPDPLVEAKLAELGAILHRIEAPFDPESAPQDDDNPWAGFWQSFAGQPFSPGFEQADGHSHSEGRGFFHRHGPTFAEAHGHAFSAGRSRQSHSWSESHARSPGHQRRDPGETREPDPDDPSARHG